MPGTAIYMVSPKVDNLPEVQDQIEWIREHIPEGPSKLVLAFGGDGEILKAFQAHPEKILFGVRIEDERSLGFYSTVNCQEIDENLVTRIKEDNFTLQEIPIMEVCVGTEPPQSFFTLNDATILRDPNGKAGKYAIRLGEDEFQAAGDGVIFATPSGSSGYNFSSGGAIISWDLFAYSLRAFNLTKGLRSISYIIPGDRKTRVISQYGAFLEVDGGASSLPPNTPVTVCLCGKHARIASLSFHGQLERVKRMVGSNRID